MLLIPVILSFFSFLIIFFYYHISVRSILRQLCIALTNGDSSLLNNLQKNKYIPGELTDSLSEIFNAKAKLEAELNECKKNIQLLSESEKQYRNFFESAPEAIICTSCDGTVFLNNTAALTLLGYSKESPLTGKKLTEFVTDAENCGIKSVFLDPAGCFNSGIRDFECEIIRASGDRFVGNIHLAGLFNSTRQTAMVFYVEDITIRKAAEAEKKRMEEQFRVAYKMEAIGQLAGGIAHDYNNILGAISGYADLIKQRYQEDDRLKKYSNMILSATNRASELTKKLLTFARKNKLNMSIFDAGEALAEIVELLNRTLDKSITISYVSDASAVYIYGDVIQFQNAIMNLALNSRDAMPGGGNLTVACTVKDIDRSFTHRKDFTVAPGKYLGVSVEDTGCGIDEKTLSHLFEPFFTTKDIGCGTGLGLASVYGTVKSHNGFIDVKSSVGKGTTFTLYFPLAEEPPLHAVSQPVHQFTGKGHVLLVDDESFLRDAVREMLLWLGHTVTSCSGGEEALALFSSKPDIFDLVILDMKMPGISGLECFRKMKKIKPDTKALISTGYSIEEEKQAMMKEGILGIIQKPYVSSQLALAVGRALKGELINGNGTGPKEAGND